MAQTKLRMNNDCIVRDRPCGRVFGGSNICFVASPGIEDVGLELDTIKMVLAQEDIEPYVAVEHFTPAKEIFCTKICTKIIESRVCIAVLTGHKGAKDVSSPNPNVYFEYGLMAAWGKPLIPVQREDQELAFNIQSLDTVRYSPGNFREKFHHALRVVLSGIEQRTPDKDNVTGLNELFSYLMEMRGYYPMPRRDRGLCNGTSFLQFRPWKFGLVLNERDTVEKVCFHTRLLYRRLEGYISRLQNEIMDSQVRCELNPGDHMLNRLHSTRTMSKQADVELIQGVQIFLVDASERDLGTQVKGELQKIETSLKPSINVLSIDEVRRETATT